MLWRQVLSGLTKGFGSENDVITSPDGDRVFVTANLPGVGRKNTMVTAAYEAATGGPLWKVPFVGPFGDGGVGHDLAVSPDGQKLFVSGVGYGTSGDDFATVAYLTSTGARVWTSQYDGPAHSSDEAGPIAITPDGLTVILLGASTGVDTDYDFTTVAYEA